MTTRTHRRIARIGFPLVLAAGLFWVLTSGRCSAEEAPAADAAPAKAPDAAANPPSDTPAPPEGTPAAPDDHAEKAPQAPEGAPSDTPSSPDETAAAPDKPADAKSATAAQTPDMAPAAAPPPNTPESKNGRKKKNGKPREAQVPANPPAQEASATSPNFETYRVVVDRNIFSSKRVPKTSASTQEVAAKPPEQVLRLMGAYLTPERTVALFAGTDEVPGGSVEVGATIAGFRVEEVRVDGAVLTGDQGRIEVPVGFGLTKKADGVWTLVDKPVVEQPEAAPASGDAAASSGAKADDPVEKLRARRRKELGQ